MNKQQGEDIKDTEDKTAGEDRSEDFKKQPEESRRKEQRRWIKMWLWRGISCFIIQDVMGDGEWWKEEKIMGKGDNPIEADIN